MSDQEHLDQQVAAIQAEIADLNTAVTGIQTELDAAKQANPGVDFSGLDAAVADLTNATDSVQGLVTPAPEPAPPPDQPTA